MIKKIITCTAVFAIFIFSISPLSLAEDEENLDLISLDLKGMNVRDVLKILSQKSGLNIVADSDVKAKVTIYVKDMDVMDVLEIIVATNNWPMKRPVPLSGL